MYAGLCKNNIHTHSFSLTQTLSRTRIVSPLSVSDSLSHPRDFSFSHSLARAISLSQNRRDSRGGNRISGLFLWWRSSGNDVYLPSQCTRNSRPTEFRDGVRRVLRTCVLPPFLVVGLGSFLLRFFHFLFPAFLKKGGMVRAVSPGYLVAWKASLIARRIFQAYDLCLCLCPNLAVVSVRVVCWPQVRWNLHQVPLCPV